MRNRTQVPPLAEALISVRLRCYLASWGRHTEGQARRIEIICSNRQVASLDLNLPGPMPRRED